MCFITVLHTFAYSLISPANFVRCKPVKRMSPVAVIQKGLGINLTTFLPDSTISFEVILDWRLRVWYKLIFYQ